MDAGGGRDMSTQERSDVLLETTGGAASKCLQHPSNQYMGREEGSMGAKKEKGG